MAEAALMDAPAVAGTPAERRLRREWDLLTQLVCLNPVRLDSPRAEDFTLHVTLRQTPALSTNGREQVDEHQLRLLYPRYFPSVPLELYLDQPMLHPNIHPVTGFVCLWQNHRIEHSVEHALHRTVAILGWQLMNLDPRHVMQPESLGLKHSPFQVKPLTGIGHSASILPAPTSLRRRLS